MLNRWIYRQKKKRIGLTIVSIVSMSVVIAMVRLAVGMIWQVVAVRQSEWYEEETLYYMTGDLFFADKIQMITMLMSLIFAGVLVYILCVASVFRKMQLEDYGFKIAGYLLCGYSKNSVREVMHMDSVFDISIAIPCSIIWYKISNHLMETVDTYVNITKVSGLKSGIMMSLYEYVISLVLVLTVVFIREEIWLRQETKKGIVHMLKNQ